MPFGLRNAAQTFQRFLDDILRDLNCFAYLDDILIASIDHASHYRDLEQVFQRLDEKGLALNIEKCISGADKLHFLGCKVSKDVISPLKEKVEALVNYPQPQDVSTLRRFLAMLDFYRRFIPNAAEIQRILYDLVKGKKKRDKTTIDWSEAAVQPFQTCKNSIAQAAVLAHPNSEAKLSLAVDASNSGIAGTLQQTYLKNTQPLAFFSRKLTRKDLEPHGTPLHCDVSTGNIRPYVPAKVTANAVKQRFVWTSLKKDCTELFKRCIPCQKSEVSRHVKSPKDDFYYLPQDLVISIWMLSVPYPLLKAISTV
ncbi:Retrovirus-related Pol polyprotein from transposon 297 [Araneus ventricosus]|uniref:RNA-directed DNA polymerase n=1 Tax=Araneus ventricosus TaxID=182803 RepID=A0A4Y2ULQ3_ARAVE|nr:Retrovirus-related Pol polyprotein from transposon 297 [Araneus ventricosus]